MNDVHTEYRKRPVTQPLRQMCSSKTRPVTSSRGGASKSVQVHQNGLQVSSVGFEGVPPKCWSYDGLGQVIAEAATTGAVTRVAYNAAGQMTSTTDPYGQVNNGVPNWGHKVA